MTNKQNTTDISTAPFEGGEELIQTEQRAYHAEKGKTRRKRSMVCNSRTNG